MELAPLLFLKFLHIRIDEIIEKTLIFTFYCPSILVCFRIVYSRNHWKIIGILRSP